MKCCTLNRTVLVATALLYADGIFAQTNQMPPTSSLIVVEDRGGVSALPYYQVLNPQLDRSAPTSSVPSPRVGNAADAQAAMLPVRSMRLSPGDVPPRPMRALPAVTPLFLIGDDTRSRSWLQQHQTALRDLRAVGLVVNVESMDALQALRRLAAGLILSPVCGDDLAERLELHHYPVLITSRGIQQ